MRRATAFQALSGAKSLDIERYSRGHVSLRATVHEPCRSIPWIAWPLCEQGRIEIIFGSARDVYGAQHARPDLLTRAAWDPDLHSMWPSVRRVRRAERPPLCFHSTSGEVTRWALHPMHFIELERGLDLSQETRWRARHSTLLREEWATFGLVVAPSCDACGAS